MSFRLANLVAGKTPVVRELATADAYAEDYGALVIVDGSGNFAACGADPASVAAVALGSVGLATPFSILGKSGFPPGRLQGASVANGVPFIAKYVGSKGTIESQYGVVRDTDGLWKVDFTETGAKVVNYLRDMSADNLGPVDEVLVTFIDSVVQPLA